MAFTEDFEKINIEELTSEHGELLRRFSMSCKEVRTQFLADQQAELERERNLAEQDVEDNVQAFSPLSSPPPPGSNYRYIVLNADESMVTCNLSLHQTMSDDQKKLLIKGINRNLLKPVPDLGNKMIYILPDEKNNSWLVVEFIPHIKRHQRKLNIYSPYSRFNGCDGLHPNQNKEIDEVFTKEDITKPREHIKIDDTSEKAMNRKDEFLFAVAYALCLAMQQDVSDFRIGLGDDNNIDNVRNVVVSLLIQKVIPINSAASEVWLHP